MALAVGMIEVFGLVAAFAAGDKNKPANADSLPVPLIVMVKFRGSVEDVRAAVEAGAEAANRVSGVVTKHVIARPEPDTEKMLHIKAFDKD